MSTKITKDMPITSVRLRGNVLSSLKEDVKIKALLCYNLNKSYPTIARWIRENSEFLTMAKALKVISEELNIPIEDLTEEHNLITKKPNVRTVEL